MKTTLSIVALAAAMALGSVGASSASDSANLCTNGSVMSGFQTLDSADVRSATNVHVVESSNCNGFASSARENPQLVSDINNNPAYQEALRRSGYPNTDIFGATLNGNELTVYIKDNN